jgi:hypothetical protein
MGVPVHLALLSVVDSYGISDLFVILAKAGIYLVFFLDPGIRRDDDT